MADLLVAENSVEALAQLLETIFRKGRRAGDKLEVLHCLVSISAQEDLSVLREFVKQYRSLVGDDLWNRAHQLYTTEKPLSWKVSYRARLLGTLEPEEEDQLENIAALLGKKPGCNALCFIFFRSRDHRRALAMPAAVPCPVAGDFKFREGQLHLSVFFRTHDAYRLGLPDLYFLRSLQREVLARAKTYAPSTKLGGWQIGQLNLFFARAFVFARQKEKAQALVNVARRFLSRRRGGGRLAT